MPVMIIKQLSMFTIRQNGEHFSGSSLFLVVQMQKYVFNDETIEPGS